jgi:hypothetical protein
VTETVHSTGLAEMIALAQSPTVANAAGVSVAVWGSVASPRVIGANKQGYLFGLHRGRLPMVEIWQVGEEPHRTSFSAGFVTSRWKIRVHVGQVDSQLAERQARLICSTLLAVIRNNIRQKWGAEQIGEFKPGVIGHQLEAQISCENTMDASSLGVVPGRIMLEDRPGCLLLESGGALLLEAPQNLGTEVLPISRCTRRGYQRTTWDGSARIVWGSA